MKKSYCRPDTNWMNGLRQYHVDPEKLVRWIWSAAGKVEFPDSFTEKTTKWIVRTTFLWQSLETWSEHNRLSHGICFVTVINEHQWMVNRIVPSTRSIISYKFLIRLGFQIPHKKDRCSNKTRRSNDEYSKRSQRGTGEPSMEQNYNRSLKLDKWQMRGILLECYRRDP